MSKASEGADNILMADFPHTDIRNPISCLPPLRYDIQTPVTETFAPMRESKEDIVLGDDVAYTRLPSQFKIMTMYFGSISSRNTSRTVPDIRTSSPRCSPVATEAGDMSFGADGGPCDIIFGGLQSASTVPFGRLRIEPLTRIKSPHERDAFTGFGPRFSVTEPVSSLTTNAVLFCVAGSTTAASRLNSRPTPFCWNVRAARSTALLITGSLANSGAIMQRAHASMRICFSVFIISIYFTILRFLYHTPPLNFGGWQNGLLLHNTTTSKGMKRRFA